jgi:hypothetical protein
MAINDYAFRASPYPVILSIEQHCGIPQQKVMFQIMKKIFGDKLQEALYLNASPDVLLPSPEELKCVGILVIACFYYSVDRSRCPVFSVSRM